MEDNLPRNFHRLIHACLVHNGDAARGSLEASRTAALITLVMSQLIHVFECRSEHRSIFRMNPFGNMKLVLAVAVSFAALAAAVMLPQLQTVFETVSLNSTSC